jgi:hypothetical protein
MLRRSFLGAMLGAATLAPTFVKAGLMPVKPLVYVSDYNGFYWPMQFRWHPISLVIDPLDSCVFVASAVFSKPVSKERTEVIKSVSLEEAQKLLEGGPVFVAQELHQSYEGRRMDSWVSAPTDQLLEPVNKIVQISSGRIDSFRFITDQYTPV